MGRLRTGTIYTEPHNHGDAPAAVRTATAAASGASVGQGRKPSMATDGWPKWWYRASDTAAAAHIMTRYGPGLNTCATDLVNRQNDMNMSQEQNLTSEHISYRVKAY